MARALTVPNHENASLADLQAAIRAGNHETQRRAMVIIMLLTGSPRSQVMLALDLKESAVRKIIAAFNRYGVDGIVAQKRPGRPNALSEETARNVIEEFEDPGKANRTFWTATAFHGYISKKYEETCSYPTLVRLLHEKGFCLKVPQPWPDRQDEEQREAFRALLAGLNADSDIDLWYGDETGIDGEPKPRRRWDRKGAKTRITKNGDHIRLNIIGSVCPRTGEFFAIEASHCDTDVFQAFLDEMARTITPTRKRNILILDNASWHKPKSLNWHFFEPMYLPPYSPDFNPIERVWLVMKQEWFNNIHCKDIETLIARADSALLDLIENPQKVASMATPIRNDL